MITDEEVDYIANSKTNALYTNPAKNGAGAYAKLVGDSEQVIAEIDVTHRCKLAVSAFYVKNHADFDTLKIGNEVRYVEEMGDTGPIAKKVRVKQQA